MTRLANQTCEELLILTKQWNISFHQIKDKKKIANPTDQKNQKYIIQSFYLNWVLNTKKMV